MDAKKNMQPKGAIAVNELFSDGSGVKIVNGCEIHLSMKEGKGRKFELKAANEEDAKAWAKAINDTIAAFHYETL